MSRTPAIQAPRDFTSDGGRAGKAAIEAIRIRLERIEAGGSVGTLDADRLAAIEARLRALEGSVSGGGAVDLTVTVPADVEIPAYAGVWMDADGFVYAPGNEDELSLVFGITETSISAGSVGKVRFGGVLSIPEGSLVPGAVYFDTDGTLTQAAPASGSIVLAGVVLTPTTLLVDIRQLAEEIEAQDVGFSPTIPGDWQFDPQTVQEGLDELGFRVTDLENAPKPSYRKGAQWYNSGNALVAADANVVKNDTITVAGTIVGWRIITEGGTGSCQIDVWKDTYANYPPVVGDSITGGNKPAVLSAIKGESSTLTGWTTSVAAGDVIAFKLESSSTFTMVDISLEIQPP